MHFIGLIFAVAICVFAAGAAEAEEDLACGLPPDSDVHLWTKTDVTKCIVDKYAFLSGGPRRDDIPSIDDPLFVLARDARFADTTPVIEIVIGGQARAYPLEIMVWHEIVNDEIAGVPVLVSYCPLCNAALVFDRRVGDAVLDFGTTGYLRHSDLVMYDRQSESWWQQYGGMGLLGEYAGATLTPLIANVISFKMFVARHKDGTILVPRNMGFRQYGLNPYRGYEQAGFPMFYRGQVPEGIAPLARVVVASDKAWTLDYIRAHAPFDYKGLHFEWVAGQNSALDDAVITKGRDVGSVLVTDKVSTASAAHHLTFAFVVHAFEPDREIITLPK